MLARNRTQKVSFSSRETFSVKDHSNVGESPTMRRRTRRPARTAALEFRSVSVCRAGSRSSAVDAMTRSAPVDFESATIETTASPSSKGSSNIWEAAIACWRGSRDSGAKRNPDRHLLWWCDCGGASAAACLSGRARRNARERTSRPDATGREKRLDDAKPFRLPECKCSKRTERRKDRYFCLVYIPIVTY